MPGAGGRGRVRVVVRSRQIEEVAGMDMLCSDKTGTLTLNKMVLQVGRLQALLAPLGEIFLFLSPVPKLGISWVLFMPGVNLSCPDD